MLNSKLISQPSMFFDSPKDILINLSLDREEKKKALENWKQSCIHLHKTTAEGMSGAGDDLDTLRNVSNALEKLNDNLKDSF